MATTDLAFGAILAEVDWTRLPTFAHFRFVVCCFGNVSCRFRVLRSSLLVPNTPFIHVPLPFFVAVLLSGSLQPRLPLRVRGIETILGRFLPVAVAVPPPVCLRGHCAWFTRLTQELVWVHAYYARAVWVVTERARSRQPRHYPRLVVDVREACSLLTTSRYVAVAVVHTT